MCVVAGLWWAAGVVVGGRLMSMGGDYRGLPRRRWDRPHKSASIGHVSLCIGVSSRCDAVPPLILTLLLALPPLPRITRLHSHSEPPLSPTPLSPTSLSLTSLSPTPLSLTVN